MLRRDLPRTAIQPTVPSVGLGGRARPGVFARENSFFRFLRCIPANRCMVRLEQRGGPDAPERPPGRTTVRFRAGESLPRGVGRGTTGLFRVAEL